MNLLYTTPSQQQLNNIYTIYLSVSLSLSLYIYIYKYIERERQIDR